VVPILLQRQKANLKNSVKIFANDLASHTVLQYGEWLEVGLYRRVRGDFIECAWLFFSHSLNLLEQNMQPKVHCGLNFICREEAKVFQSGGRAFGYNYVTVV